jgi:hypothetical protein
MHLLLVHLLQVQQLVIQTGLGLELLELHHIPFGAVLLSGPVIIFFPRQSHMISTPLPPFSISEIFCLVRCGAKEIDLMNNGLIQIQITLP